MIKREEIAQPASCLNKAQSDEPIFVLRAKDRAAPAAVEAWADHVGALGLQSQVVVAEAKALAAAMRNWRANKVDAAGNLIAKEAPAAWPTEVGNIPVQDDSAAPGAEAGKLYVQDGSLIMEKDGSAPEVIASS